MRERRIIVAKRLNYEIGITADTSQLKAEIKALQQSLDSISSKKINLGFDTELKEAAIAAESLKHQFQQAFNQDTGKLDLSKLNKSINQSGMSLEKYRIALASIGPEGEKAFIQVANAISKAQTPVVTMGKKMDELWITMKNTARWQLTSSAMHGFMGAVSTAYGYTKDLNKSLNNIRIVSGQSVEQMHDFAKEATEAAKVLSATTTDYTDAALIYYQQGLVGDQVSERADATIKMANVTGDAAEKVSDQLTAIWNNFYDGSKSLEYYADVITALGAATASSTSEISEGLEKFASIADTIGLSYEYATTSLATIVDQTRQAPETVGTALKTIFARIQGLSLGETLDDGTDLNKYSEALSKVGINIFDANGQLKDMDALLDELGNKWDTLNKAQQMALAQTVAGVRQYTQLVALLDNWDSFQANLTTALTAEGELDYQAEIYADSWEAARNRVRASAEGIYDSIIDDDLFIELNNNVANVLDIIEQVIDSFNGLGGILTLTGTLMTRVYGDKLAQGIRNTVQNIKILSGVERERNEELKKQAQHEIEQVVGDSDTHNREVTAMKQRAKIEAIIEKAREKNNTQLVKDLELQLQLFDIQTDQTRELLTQRDALEQQLNIATRLNSLEVSDISEEQMNTARAWVDVLGEDVDLLSTKKQILSNLSEDYQTHYNLSKKEADMLARSAYSKIQQENAKKIKEINIEYGKAQHMLEFIQAAQKDWTKDADDSKKKIIELNEIFERLSIEGASFTLDEDGDVEKQLNTWIEQLNEIIRKITQEMPIIDLLPEDEQAKMYQLAANAEEMGRTIAKVEVSDGGANIISDNAIETLEKGNIGLKDYADQIINVAGAASMAATNVQLLSSSITTIFSSSEDVSGLDRLISAMTALSFIAPSLISDLGQVTKSGELVAAKSALAAGGVRGLAGAFGALSKSVAGANLMISGISIAIGLISGIIQTLIQRAEELRQKQIEQNKETLAEIETNKELINNYETLLKTYKETGEGKSELIEASEKVADKIGYEGIAVANLTGDYEELNKELKDYIKNQNELEVETRRQSKDFSAEEFIEGATKGSMASGAFREGINLGSLNFSQFENGAQEEAFLNSDLYNNFSGRGSGSGYYSVESKNKSASKLVAIYEATQQAVVDIREAAREAGEEESAALQNASKWLAENREAYKALKAEVDAYNQAVLTDISNNELADTSTVDNYKEYKEYINSLDKALKKRVEVNELTQEEADLLKEQKITQDEILQGYNLREKFAQDFADKFNNEQEIDNLDDFINSASDEEIQVAVSVLPNVGSIEEFKNEFTKSLTEAITQTAISSNQVIDEIISNINSNSMISEDNYKTLMADEGFREALEKSYNDLSTFQMQSIQTQLEFIRDYHTEALGLAASGLAEQTRITEEEIGITKQKILSIQALEEQASDDLQEIARLQSEYTKAKTEEEKSVILSQYNDLKETIMSDHGIDIKFDIDENIDIDALNLKLEKLLEKIQEITKQKIELAVDWSGLDGIKEEVDSLADAATDLQKNAKKVGNSYQYPVNEVRKWMELYPDLFAEAEATTKGLIKLDQSKVDAYIKAREAETEENIKNKIENWELEKKDLEVVKARILGEIEAIETAKEGEINAEKLTAESKASLIEQLTEYGMICDTKAQDHQAVAMAAMAENAQTYEEIVKEVSANNAKNLTESSAEGAEKSMSNFEKVGIVVSNLGHNVLELAKSVVAALAGKEYQAQFISLTGGVDNTVKFKGYTSESKEFKTAQFDNSTDMIESFKAQKLDQLKNLDLKAIQNAIDNIDAKIVAAQAMVNAPAQEGSNGPDKRKSSGSNKATIEELKKVFERYHEITREIEYQEKILNDLEKDIDRTYSLDKIKLYKKQQEELSKLLELEDKKKLAALADIEIDKNTLKDLGLNPVVDAESFDLTNYTKLLNQATNEYNKYMESYNAMSKKQQEAHEKEKKAVEEKYDKQIKALEQYEKTVDTYREQLEKWEDLQRELEDSKLTELNAKLELVLDLKKAKDEVRDFARDIIESFGDEITHGAESLQNQFTGALANMDLTDDFSSQQTGLIDLINNANKYTNMEDLSDSLDDLRGEIISTGEALLDWLDTLENAFPEAIDAARERFEIFTGELSHNKDILDTMKEIVELQNSVIPNQTKQDKYSFIDKVTSSQLEAVMGQAQLEKKRYDESREALELAWQVLQGYDEGDAGHDGAYNNWVALLAENQEAEQAWLNKTKEAMEQAQAIYLNAIENISYNFEQAITNNMGLDLLQDKYDNYIEEEERYLDEVNELYEINKYNNKLQKDIDNTANQAHRAQLQALQQEIQARAENNKLSEYDLQIMEAKYNALQKQIALEEAQNNKSEVRLKRDAQGNWSYQFTTNNDEIAAAEEETNAATNEYYNIAKQQVKDVTGDIIATWQEMNDKIKEVYEDESLTVAEREAQIAEIREYYKNKILDLEEQKNIALEDMTAAGSETIQNFGNEYGDTLNNMADVSDNFAETFDNYIQEMEDSLKEYEKTTLDIGHTTETTYGQLEEQIDATSDSTEYFTEVGLDATNMMWDQLDILHEQINGYLAYADAVMEAVRALQQLANQNVQAKENMSQESGSGALGFDQNTDYMAQAINQASSGHLKDSMISLQQRQEKVEYNGGSYDATSDYDMMTAIATLPENERKELRYLLSSSAGGYTSASVTKWLKEHGVMFDTGGYTGSFDGAKAALLHEKELVLNQQDTANILSAVSAVRTLEPTLLRSIEQMLDVSAMNSLRSMCSSLSTVSSFTAEPGVLEQMLNITAEFPNATDQNEIREAILGLANYATQFVNKR